jgi:hypothetical protein
LWIVGGVLLAALLVGLSTLAVARVRRRRRR